VLFPSPSPSTPAAKSAQIIPRNFFEKSQQRALPVVTYNIMEPHQTAMLKLVPIEPGDELWLMDQFYAWAYPNGGQFDLARPTLRGRETHVWSNLAT